MYLTQNLMGYNFNACNSQTINRQFSPAIFVRMTKKSI